MAFKAKQKGNAFERQSARLLTDWTSEKFHRIPNSGALRWGGKAWVYGDLMPPETFPTCVIECKHHKTADLDDTIRLTPQDSNILGWWDQVLEDCVRCTSETDLHPMPILLYKANYRPVRICFLRSFMEYLVLAIPHVIVATGKADVPDLVAMDLIDFTNAIPYLEFKRAYQQFAQACNT